MREFTDTDEIFSPNNQKRIDEIKEFVSSDYKKAWVWTDTNRVRHSNTEAYQRLLMKMNITNISVHTKNGQVYLVKE